METMTRKEALRKGVRTYRTGKPCKHGHNAERYTLSGTCAECITEHKAREREIFSRSRAEADSGGHI